MNKLKIAIAVVAAAAALAFIGAYLHARLHDNDLALVEQNDRIARLEAENARLSNLVLHPPETAPPPLDPSLELLRLRGEVAVLRRQTNELDALRAENIRLSQAVGQAQTNQLPADEQLILRQHHAADAVATLLQALKSYATNHQGQFPASLDQLLTTGDLKPSSLPGNLGPGDFEFVPGRGANPQGYQLYVRLRVPIPKPGGGGLMIGGGLNDAGVPYTSAWNIVP